MNNVNLSDFIDIVFKKLNKSVDKSTITDIYIIIIEYIYSSLINNISFTIDNFGSFTKRLIINENYALYFKKHESLCEFMKQKNKKRK